MLFLFVEVVSASCSFSGRKSLNEEPQENPDIIVWLSYQSVYHSLCSLQSHVYDIFSIVLLFMYTMLLQCQAIIYVSLLVNEMVNMDIFLVSSECVFFWILLAKMCGFVHV